MEKIRRTTSILQEFSVPLIAGIVLALAAANLAPDWYHHLVHWAPLGDAAIFGHQLTLHFLVNDAFMVFFFAIAAKEITEACLPGGSLNPFRKALSPLFATIGGVVVPVAVFFAGLALCSTMGALPSGASLAEVGRGWGIPTATDIALAWLVARTVFGKGHPAIDFLLLLAIADDAIGLVIIAAFYGDPSHPVQPGYLLLVAVAMGVAAVMRKSDVKSWPAYIFGAGPIAWSGLLLAQLHPALALVFIVPFLPAPKRDTGLFVAEDEVDLASASPAASGHDADHAPLHLFEHQTKVYVDLGLFFFSFANAGVAFAEVGSLTWLVLASLVIGKTAGVYAFARLGECLGFALPAGMSRRDLLGAGFVAALGLTVALFVAGAAFQDPTLQGQAKMGALCSGLVGLAAIPLGRWLGLGRRRTSRDEAGAGSEEVNTVAPTPAATAPSDDASAAELPVLVAAGDRADS